ncbi:MAG: hypothetical protein ACKVP0_27660 [Pirellulaceae bacterium]
MRRVSVKNAPPFAVAALIALPFALYGGKREEPSNKKRSLVLEQLGERAMMAALHFEKPPVIFLDAAYVDGGKVIANNDHIVDMVAAVQRGTRDGMIDGQFKNAVDSDGLVRWADVAKIIQSDLPAGGTVALPFDLNGAPTNVMEAIRGKMGVTFVAHWSNASLQDKSFLRARDQANLLLVGGYDDQGRLLPNTNSVEGLILSGPVATQSEAVGLTTGIAAVKQRDLGLHPYQIKVALQRENPQGLSAASKSATPLPDSAHEQGWFTKLIGKVFDVGKNVFQTILPSVFAPKPSEPAPPTIVVTHNPTVTTTVDNHVIVDNHPENSATLSASPSITQNQAVVPADPQKTTSGETATTTKPQVDSATSAPSGGAIVAFQAVPSALFADPTKTIALDLLSNSSSKNVRILGISPASLGAIRWLHDGIIQFDAGSKAGSEQVTITYGLPDGRITTGILIVNVTQPPLMRLKADRLNLPSGQTTVSFSPLDNDVGEKLEVSSVVQPVGKAKVSLTADGRLNIELQDKGQMVFSFDVEVVDAFGRSSSERVTVNAGIVTDRVYADYNDIFTL